MRSMYRRNTTCEARPPRRTFPPLSTGPSLKTERFQRGRSCGTGGNPVRGAPARLHRRKLLVKGGSGGRRAAWKPRRPPAAFGSFPLRERNSCVRRRTKLPQAAFRHLSVCRLSPAAFGSFPLRERNSCVRRSNFVKDIVKDLRSHRRLEFRSAMF